MGPGATTASLIRRHSSSPHQTTLLRHLGVKACVVEIEARNSSPQEIKKALDNFCDPPGFVVGWTGEQLHLGRVYPPAAHSGSNRACSPVDFGPTVGDLMPVVSNPSESELAWQSRVRSQAKTFFE